MMSSVAKDLRIMVVDSVGRLVTGADFTVTIQGMGEYTDSDRDGVIYVDGLRSGEYSVSLNEKMVFACRTLSLRYRCGRILSTGCSTILSI